jgi:hypothetical protein
MLEAIIDGIAVIMLTFLYIFATWPVKKSSTNKEIQ